MGEEREQIWDRAVRDRKRQEKLKFPSTQLVLSWRNERNVEEVRGKEGMKLIVCLRQGPSYTFLSPIPHTLYRAFAFRPQSNGFVNFQVKGKKKNWAWRGWTIPWPYTPWPGSLQRSRLCRCLYFGVQSENKTCPSSYPSALISLLLWLCFDSPHLCGHLLWILYLYLCDMRPLPIFLATSCPLEGDSGTTQDTNLWPSSRLSPA